MKNFKNVTTLDIAKVLIEHGGRETIIELVAQILDDPNYSLIDAIELYAEKNGLISSENDLSERFDKEIAPSVTDETMIKNAFEIWVDSLCLSGELHDEQFSHYSYDGKYS